MTEDELIDLAILRDVPYKRSNGFVMMSCPNLDGHGNGDRRPSFGMSISQDIEQSWCNCFGCGIQGKSVWVYNDLFGKGYVPKDVLDYIVSKEMLSLQTAYNRLTSKKNGSNNGCSEFYRLLKAHPVFRANKSANSYLLDRGIKDFEIKELQIGYDKWRRRVTFPIFDIKGDFSGIIGRSVCEEEPKYWVYPGSQKSIFLGENTLDTTISDITLVEGVMDYIFTRRSLPNTVAVLGTNTMTRGKLERLLNFGDTFNLFLDGDQAGEEAREKMGSVLRNRAERVFVMRCPQGTDPGDLSKKQIETAYLEREVFL